MAPLWLNCGSNLALPHQAHLRQPAGGDKGQLQEAGPLRGPRHQPPALEVGSYRSPLYLLPNITIARYYVCLHIEFVLEHLENNAPGLVPQFVFDICKR